jgi:hypothetical protein
VFQARQDRYHPTTLLKEPGAFAELEGEVQDAMPAEQEYQTGTTVLACLMIAARGVEMAVHISVKH